MSKAETETSEALDPDDTLYDLVREIARLPDHVPAATPIRVGDVLGQGRLRILRRLGEGGMGVVFEAHDEQRRIRVALKTLTHLQASDIYRLKNEFRALANVYHPNLVQLFELFAEGERWYFTMELVEGERFDRWVRTHNACDPSRLRPALRQLSEAIAAIHDAGQLHRDLKPSNVLVTRAGRVVVLDFGLASASESGGVGRTLSDFSVTGTPAYMAPEQAAGKPACTASDYYALGVMLYEALTGELPFMGRALDMLVDKQRCDAPSASAAAPHDLALLCDALLARDPGSRPDATALCSRLGAAPFLPEREITAVERSVLIGRAEDLGQLHAAYAAAASGAPISLFLSGESGIGKSVLCAAFLEELRGQGEAVVLTGRCHERECVPFKGIDSLVDDLSRFLRRLPAEEAAALMPREVYALARLFPALARVPAVERAPQKQVADAQELRLRAFTAFCELLGRIRDRRPLVFHIDDAQWLDRDAVTFLTFLLAQQDPPALLLLLSHRSEPVAGHALLAQLHQRLQGARFQRRTWALSPLSDAAAHELAALWLGRKHAALTRAIAASANGSPFFIGALARQVRLGHDPAQLSVEDALRTQILASSAGARQLLQLLALSERPLAVQLALDVAEATHADLDALHAMQLVRRGDNETLGVECYHARVRECALHMLTRERLKSLHAQLLAALEREPDMDVEQLAQHALAAEDRPAAARYTQAAAARASAAMAFEQAAVLYARTIELGAHDEPGLRALHTELAVALAHAGKGAQAADAYLEAARGAPTYDALELKRCAAEQLLKYGCLSEGKALLDEVLRAFGLHVPGSPRDALLALAWERTRLKLRGLRFRARTNALPLARRRELDMLWSAAHGLQTIDMVTGVALSTRYLRCALDAGMPDDAARALGNEAWFTCATGGAAAEVEVLCARAQALALVSGRPETLAWVELMRAATALMRAEHRAALEHAERALELLRERCTGVAFQLSAARMFALTASNALGKFASVADLSQLIDEAARRGDALAATTLTCSSAPAWLVHDAASELWRHIEEARHYWKPMADGYVWPHAEILLAQCVHACYAGDHRRLLERLSQQWSLLERGHFLRVPALAATLRVLRAGAALRAARDASGDAAELYALARRDARALSRIAVPDAPAFQRLIYAGLAHAQGRHARAVALLRETLQALAAAGNPAPYVVGVRRRLGELLRDQEGALLVTDTGAKLHEMGAVNLAATTRLFSFGIELAPL